MHLIIIKLTITKLFSAIRHNSTIIVHLRHLKPMHSIADGLNYMILTEITH